MKHCGRCKRDRPLSDFWKDKSQADGLDGWCRHCRKEYNTQYAKRVKAERQEFVRAYKEERGCEECGQKFPHFMLEFDHARGVKDLCIGDGVNNVGIPWKKVLAELEKCDVVCGNCHKRRTWERREVAVASI